MDVGHALEAQLDLREQRLQEGHQEGRRLEVRQQHRYLVDHHSLVVRTHARETSFMRARVRWCVPYRARGAGRSKEVLDILSGKKRGGG